MSVAALQEHPTDEIEESPMHPPRTTVYATEQTPVSPASSTLVVPVGAGTH